MSAVDPVNAEEWDYLDIDVLKLARSSRVCMTCQHFRYEVGRHCVTLLTCPIHQGLIPQGEHLTRRCSRWVRFGRLRLVGVQRRRDAEGRQRVYGRVLCPRTHFPLLPKKDLYI